MENKFNKGDLVFFNHNGKTLSGKIISLDYGTSYKVCSDGKYFIVHDSGLSKEHNKEDKVNKEEAKKEEVKDTDQKEDKPKRGRKNKVDEK